MLDTTTLETAADDTRSDDTLAFDGTLTDSASADSGVDAAWSFDASGFGDAKDASCAFSPEGGVDLAASGSPPPVACLAGKGAMSELKYCPGGTVCVRVDDPSVYAGFTVGCVKPENALACSVHACGSIGCAGTCEVDATSVRCVFGGTA